MASYYAMWVVVQRNGKPVKALSGEMVVFATLKGARDWIREMKGRGDIHYYGRDTWDVRGLRIDRPERMEITRRDIKE